MLHQAKGICAYLFKLICAIMLLNSVNTTESNKAYSTAQVITACMQKEQIYWSLQNKFLQVFFLVNSPHASFLHCTLHVESHINP